MKKSFLLTALVVAVSISALANQNNSSHKRTTPASHKNQRQAFSSYINTAQKQAMGQKGNSQHARGSQRMNGSQQMSGSQQMGGPQQMNGSQQMDGSRQMSGPQQMGSSQQMGQGRMGQGNQGAMNGGNNMGNGDMGDGNTNMGPNGKRQSNGMVQGQTATVPQP